MSNEDLVRQYQEGNYSILDELTKQNTGLIRIIANKYAAHSEYTDFDDLFQEGWTGFLRAVQTYNPDHPNSAKFSTWAVYWIKQKIVRYLEQKTPKTKEISIFEQMAEDMSLIDCIEDPEVERNLWRYVEIRELRKELEEVMDKYLTLKQSEILKMYYGWNNNVCFTFSSIGDVLGLSTQNIIQQHNRALRRIRETGWGRKQMKEMAIERRIRVNFSNPISYVIVKDIEKIMGGGVV